MISTAMCLIPGSIAVLENLQINHHPKVPSKEGEELRSRLGILSPLVATSQT